jgi:hypothetical protein
VDAPRSESWVAKKKKINKESGLRVPPAVALKGATAKMIAAQTTDKPTKTKESEPGP